MKNEGLLRLQAETSTSHDPSTNRVHRTARLCKLSDKQWQVKLPGPCACLFPTVEGWV